MPSTREIARHIGVSQQMVVKLCKAGMPKNSLRAVELWREARGKKRAATHAGAGKFAEEPKRKGRPIKPRKPAQTGDSLLDALTNSIAVSEGAFEDYEYARVHQLATRSIRLAEHNKAIDSRAKMEKLYREELERRKLLVPKHEIIDMCRRCMEPVLRRLKKIPNEQGPQVNPAQPLMATEILEQAIAAVIEVGHSSLEALK